MMRVFKKKIITILNKLPYIKGLYNLKVNYDKNSCYPPGHFYSPIISVEDIKSRETEIWPEPLEDKVNGIDLQTNSQLELITQLSKYYPEIPFKDSQSDKLRYWFKNPFYAFTDGIVLHTMIRHLKPERIIEVGSGFSSALMLDTNDLFFDNSIHLTFIEPYPMRLNSLISQKDKANSTIVENVIQKVSLDVFKELQAGDILFIDSTHVSKTGSDVNYILFDILPVLNTGVLIHFHDVFFPFEYPKNWVFKGRNWNEDYFLKAFLMYNINFEIRLFSHYIHALHSDAFKEMPLCYKNTGGNLWIEKTT